MLKWKILAVIGLAFGVAGVVWGYAAQKNAIGFFELRVYTTQPGKRDALAIDPNVGEAMAEMERIGKPRSARRGNVGKLLT